MLEILFLRFFVRQLRAIAVGKNRPASWAMLGVVLWFTGEITGLVLGMQGSEISGDTYACALLGAAFGAILAYVIVASRPSLSEQEFPVARLV